MSIDKCLFSERVTGKILISGRQAACMVGVISRDGVVRVICMIGVRVACEGECATCAVTVTRPGDRIR